MVGIHLPCCDLLHPDHSLTEQQVKGWVTSSYESKKTMHMTSDNVTHPTGSWNNFITSVSSSLRNMIDVDESLPW